MKRIFALCMLTVLLLTGCTQGKKTESTSGEERPVIVATIFPLYDFARQVAGDRATVKMLLAPGMEVHSYDPSPKDILTVQHSSLFLYIGGESDAWVDRVTSAMDKPETAVLRLMDSVDCLEEEAGTGMRQRKADGEESEYDEHIWTSPVNAVRMVEAIRDRLCQMYPGDAEAFRQNAADYIEKLQQLDTDFSTAVAAADRKELLFGDRFPFRYFVERYGLTYSAAFPGCSAETEPSAETVASLIDRIRTQKIPVIFYLELSNHRVADVLAESTGAKTRMFHSCETVTQTEFDSGATYLSIMYQNLENLKEALSGEAADL